MWTDLPDGCAEHVSSYLPKLSRAVMAAALTPPPATASSGALVPAARLPARARLLVSSAEGGFDVVDFAELDESVASRLTDADVCNILSCIEAGSNAIRLKLAGCSGITGAGLEPIRGSSVLEQIDLRRLVKDEHYHRPENFLLSTAATLPIIASIFTKEGSKLKHLSLPLNWCQMRSKWCPASPPRETIRNFLSLYEQYLSGRQFTCENTNTNNGTLCGNACPGSSGEHDVYSVTWIVTENGGGRSPSVGCQNTTCFECLRFICNDCRESGSIATCLVCMRDYCVDCVETVECEKCCEGFENVCVRCSGASRTCDRCDSLLCGDCAVADECSDCGQSGCIICLQGEPWGHHNNGAKCQRKGCKAISCENCWEKRNCTVRECPIKSGHDYCYDCRVKTYHEKDDFDCTGCYGLLVPKLLEENERLRRQVEELQNRKPASIS